jgi:hypothetical protein
MHAEEINTRQQTWGAHRRLVKTSHNTTERVYVMPEVVRGGRRGFDGVGRDNLDVNFHFFSLKKKKLKLPKLTEVDS